jgi:tonB-system energizer ExbB
MLPSALPRDLSPWGMFQNAVPLVKAVMIALAIASLVTWTVWLAKTIELWKARRLAGKGLEILAGATSLRAAEAELASIPSPVSRFATAAAGEADRSEGLDPEGVKERASVLLSRIEARAGRLIARGTGTLATIGATAVFVGLFGTVWGIMDSFIGISKTNTTNLAVVAPGIAEALLATALSLRFLRSLSIIPLRGRSRITGRSLAMRLPRCCVICPATSTAIALPMPATRLRPSRGTKPRSFRCASRRSDRAWPSVSRLKTMPSRQRMRSM